MLVVTLVKINTQNNQDYILIDENNYLRDYWCDLNNTFKCDINHKYGCKEGAVDINRSTRVNFK